MSLLSVCDFENVSEAIVMETAHCGKVRGESFAVACLKLLDEELYVGGNHFFGRLRLGTRGKGSNIAGFIGGGVAAHGDGSSVFEWSCCVCSQTRLGPGLRQQGRQVQEGGAPPLERSGSGVEGA